MRALRNALSVFQEQVSHRPLLLLLDNTSAVYALRKGGAKAYRLNEELSCVQDLLHDTCVRVAYIESHLNPADFPSRGKGRTLQLPCDFRALGRRLAGSAMRVCVPRQC